MIVRPGTVNQSTRFMITRIETVAPTAITKVVILRFRAPGMIDAHRSPEAALSRAMSQTGSCGSSWRKSLKPMAMYCLSSTATQKIGREKNRNEMKVTV